jgi:hypothetical protein
MVVARITALSDKMKDLIAEARLNATRERSHREPYDAPSYGSLVRRWREADHPGENALVAMLASDAVRGETKVHAVGIGWGGIELPFVFEYLSDVLFPGGEKLLHIAEWSHYRGSNEDVRWYGFPNHSVDGLKIDGERVVLFDDNTLTGVTLEHLRDELVLQGASKVDLFITRYSGERRHAQMLMKNHGAVDPGVLADRVGGYLAETPFVRSWSLKDYRNSIGAFSLSRRRILECIHNNSTVELYQREGF